MRREKRNGQSRLLQIKSLISDKPNRVSFDKFVGTTIILCSTSLLWQIINLKYKIRFFNASLSASRIGYLKGKGCR